MHDSGDPVDGDRLVVGDWFVVDDHEPPLGPVPEPVWQS
jgi:hypothetical protein